MSIIRVGLSETEQFSVGYDAIFGSRRSAAKPKVAAKPKGKPKSAGARKPAAGKKKPARKKR